MVTEVTQNNTLDETFADELDPGTTLLNGQYRIEQFLNAGGFGITYTALDSLDRRIVIKECFPSAFCRRDGTRVSPRNRAHSADLSNVIRLFAQEAKSLAKLNHPSIVGVHDVFEDNDTAYMALDYVAGRDLLDIIETPELMLDPGVVQDLLEQMLDAIGYTHDMGVLHRDVSPDNILMGQYDIPILIDFGAAREQASTQTRAMSALRVVKDGYSPQEFYIAGAEQGPYSDLYALAASFYHLISGQLAPDAQTRLSAIAGGEADPYQPLTGTLPTYPNAFLSALDKAMSILPKDRMQSADEWLEALDDSLEVAAFGAMTDTSSNGKRRNLTFSALMAGGGVMAALTVVAMLLPPVETGFGLIASTASETETNLKLAEVKEVPQEPVIRLEDQLIGSKPTVPTENTQIETASLQPLNLTETVASAGLQTQLQETALTEKRKEPQLAFTKSRHLALPIVSRDPDTGQITQIFAIDGRPVTSQTQIDAILNAKITPVTGYFARFVVKAGPNPETARNQLKVLRVADRLTLANGLSFQAVRTNSGWETQTIAVPASLDVNLEPGDVLVGDLTSNALLSEPDALDTLLQDQVRKGEATIAFAVRRGSKTWATEIDLNDTKQAN
ncbi:MAG: serine/threonine-protein kinase [Pseudomonadota bacterium]